MVTTKGTTKENDHLVRKGHDRVFQRMLFFFRCNVHAGWHHLVTDDRHVRWHQSGGAPRLATPLSTPPVSSTRDTASDREPPGYQTESAITYADFRGLSTAPSQTACPGHQRWGTFYNNRAQTVISPPWLAVSLWTHRQGDACVCRIGPLLHTFVAGLPGRYHGRRAADGRIGLGTSRSRLSSGDRLVFAVPSVGSLHGFLRRAYLIF